MSDISLSDFSDSDLADSDQKKGSKGIGGKSQKSEDSSSQPKAAASDKSLKPQQSTAAGDKSLKPQQATAAGDKSLKPQQSTAAGDKSLKPQQSTAAGDKKPPAKSASTLPTDSKQLKPSASKVDGEKGNKLTTDTEKERRRKNLETVSRSLDRATGVLSPPDFFISKIIHDGKCFTPKVGHSVVEANGNIFIYGGGEDSGPSATADLVKFTPGLNVFELLDVPGVQPGARRAATLNVWKSGEAADPCLLLFGGVDQDSALPEGLWAFDLKKNSWKELDIPNTPEPRHSHAAVVCDKTNAFFVFGGQGVTNQVIKEGHVLKGSTWTLLKSTTGENSPCARSGHSAAICTLDGKRCIAVFGGDTTGAGKGINDLWLYNIRDDSWQLVDDFSGEPPLPRWKHACAFFDNRLWIMGGTYAGWFRNYVMSDFFVFDFFAKCWFKCDLDPKDLGYHTDVGALTVLPSNRAIYIFGGADHNGIPSSDVYRLAPVCTSVSISSLRGEISKAVAGVNRIRQDMETTLENFEKQRQIIGKLETSCQNSETQLNQIVANAKQSEEKVKELADYATKLTDSVKQLEQSVVQSEAKLEAYKRLEQKFSIMEVTLQEALAKLEQKADLNAAPYMAKQGGGEDSE